MVGCWMVVEVLNTLIIHHLTGNGSELLAKSNKFKFVS